MAGKRKQISKKTRFEVFKRDKFTCQYCGKSAPDVILHVDHIKPVSKGGTNDIMNLITSCDQCNFGKGARELSDDSVIKKQQHQLQELAEKNEQLEMLLKWKEGIVEIKDKEAITLNKYLSDVFNVTLSEYGIKQAKKLIKKYGIDLVIDAADIAYSTYYDGTQQSRETAFNKIGGICYNKTRTDQRNLYYYNYMNKVCINKMFYYNPDALKKIAYQWIKTEDEFEDVKGILQSSKNWTEFINTVYDEFDM